MKIFIALAAIAFILVLAWFMRKATQGTPFRDAHG